VNVYSTAGKIRPLGAAVDWRGDLSGRVVFTNGVFDLLHRGHVEYLEQARALGDHLIVAVNSDGSARGLAKAPGRPLLPDADRGRVVAARGVVDCGVIFLQPTPQAAITALTPDVRGKGGENRRATVVGADFVERRGGRVVIVPLVAGNSTTGIVERIRETS
jgi:D-beta-D-heptose 7-phosphate kinase/D-beta-D-heptose 1-phosphate adenosyltransferase